MIVLANRSTGFRRLVREQVICVIGGVSDVDRLNQLIPEHRIDAIMHFAGLVVVSESVSDPLGYYFNNTVKGHDHERSTLPSRGHPLQLASSPLLESAMWQYRIRLTSKSSLSCLIRA